MWRALAYQALSFPLGLCVGVFTIALVAMSTGLAVVVVVDVPVVWFTFFAAANFGAMERSRAAALLGVKLVMTHEPLSSRRWWPRLLERLKSASRWREIGYLSLAFPLLASFGIVILSIWALLLTLAALPAFVSYLPGGSADFGMLRIHAGAGSIAACAVGLVGLVVVAPQLTMALAALDRQTVRWLLGQRPPSTLKRKVEELEISRGAAVDSAQAERARIERDLHDGAQQRLVALAMDLGRARERFDSSPDEARRLVDDAHREAKEALVELRDLARGIHPAILRDRGLDAALSSIIAKCHIPVVISTDLPQRLPDAIESAAYFIVAEALTNVTKHAKATRVDVTIALQNNRLVVEVRDDGRGGAVLSAGGGLSGLSDRVRALGGWLRVLSPLKGPTSVIAELPCES